MTARYRMDPGHSRFTVQAFATGLLSFMGHSPTFAVRDFTGELRFEPEAPEGGWLEVVVPAGALALADDVKSSDRQEIEARMGREVLEIDRYPEIRFRAEEVQGGPIAPNRYRLRVSGLLALHGVTGRQELEAELFVYNDGIRLAGEFALRLSDYHIRPVTALGGAIKLQDRLRGVFDIAAWRESE